MYIPIRYELRRAVVAHYYVLYSQDLLVDLYPTLDKRAQHTLVLS